MNQSSPAFGKPGISQSHQLPTPQRELCRSDQISSIATRDAQPLSARSARGQTRLLLRRLASGLYVEREDIPSRGIRTVQSMLFVSERTFEDWCQAEPLRFDSPLLHASLRREAALLWSTDHASPPEQLV